MLRPLMFMYAQVCNVERGGGKQGDREERLLIKEYA